MHEAVHHCQEASILHQLVSIVKTGELIVVPPGVMIHPFCCVSGLHQRASIVLGL